MCGAAECGHIRTRAPGSAHSPQQRCERRGRGAPQNWGGTNVLATHRAQHPGSTEERKSCQLLPRDEKGVGLDEVLRRIERSRTPFDLSAQTLANQPSDGTMNDALLRLVGASIRPIH